MNPKHKPGKTWVEEPFILYLAEVDRLLEDEFHTKTTTQSELVIVATAQEEMYTPMECANDICLSRGLKNWRALLGK